MRSVVEHITALAVCNGSLQVHHTGKHMAIHCIRRAELSPSVSIQMCQIVYIFRVKQSLVLFKSFIPDKFTVFLCLTKYRNLFNCPLTTNHTASWCRLTQTIKS